MALMWVWLPLKSWLDWCHVFPLKVFLLTSVCRQGKPLTSFWMWFFGSLAADSVSPRAWVSLLSVFQPGLFTVTEWSLCFWHQPPRAFHRLTHTLEGVKNTYEWIFTCEIQTTVPVILSKSWTGVWPEESNCPWHNWLNFIETTSFVLPLTT